MLPLSAISAAAAVLFGVLWLKAAPNQYYVTSDMVRMRVKTAWGACALISLAGFGTFQFVIPYQGARTAARIGEVLPVYPGSRLELDSAVEPDTRILMFSTDEAVDAVRRFLLSEAPSQGWTAANPGQAPAPLQFRSDDGRELRILVDSSGGIGDNAATTIRYILTEAR